MSKDIFSGLETPWISLKNRVVMSAMTRGFSENKLCTEEMEQYYVRRAKNDIGCIITEGIIIDPSGDGYNNVPHISSIEQAESWRKTINAVHDCNAKIVAQLWHCGRISHSDYTGGIAPVSSTNIAASGINRQNNKPFGKPEALEQSGIKEIIQKFVHSTKLALDCGFDAVEIHMANGYLIDQFLDSRVNDRTDNYGGSVENRCRFAIELLSVLIETFGPERIIIRISPSRFMGGIYNWPDMDEMLSFFVQSIKKIGLKIIDITCANADYYETSGPVIRRFRELGWDGVIIGGASLTLEQANNEIKESHVDLVTWGRSILANVEFVSKLKNNEELLSMTDEIRMKLF
jgi:2,4-dienoyl-CoA reductase-like NADH-dependent reductase (Old Yellow Enzyme family)